MKTRVLNFSKLFFSVVFCLGLTACNKDDFYEKEFLESPFQERPAPDGPDNDGAKGSNIPDKDGGTQGGVDSGVDGGTTGGTTGGPISSGGSSGGDDVGSSTGGADGFVTGGTSGGSTDYSDCNQGHGNDPSRIDKSNPNIGTEPFCKEELFFQASSQTKKLDIVWIIDNSGSMRSEQESIAINFNYFIQDFIDKDIDFKMGITTTDTRAAHKGLMVTGSEEKLNSVAAKENPDQFIQDFKTLINVGTRGSGHEKGLEASEGFMQRYSASFVRSDAYLAVVIVSDEEDQSPKTPSEYADYLKSFKTAAGLIKIYSIVDTELTSSGSGITTGFERYAKASSETAGTVSNIRDDFYHSLTAMGDSLMNLLDSFALENTPVDGSIKVYVDGVFNTNYTYDAVSRSIKFDANHLPPVGAEIKVQYVKK
jgi:hypothetical protein